MIDTIILNTYQLLGRARQNHKLENNYNYTKNIVLQLYNSKKNYNLKWRKMSPNAPGGSLKITKFQFRIGQQPQYKTV